MNTYRISQVFLALMGLAFANTGIQALISPQAVLANVGIILDNASALSSMRAVYGGMHLAFGIFCIVGIFQNTKTALILVALYTIGFVTGRLSGVFADGAPNSFVTTWLTVETICFIVSVLLLKTQVRSSKSEVQGELAS